MGAGAKAPSRLASFAHNWVGGDMHGLSAYAGTLYGYVPKLTDVATALDKQVSHIVGDAGWQGSAASAFSKAWEKDAVGATALGIMLSSAGDIVNTLAANLASTESALEEAADQTAAAGVPIGAGGQPPQACYSDPAKEQARTSYLAFWNQCMHAAAIARSQAAGALQKLGTAATEGGDDAGLGDGDYTALFDVLAGFFGAQTRYRAYVDSKLPGLKKTLTKAFDDNLAAARQANGQFGSWDGKAHENYGDASARLKSVQDDLADAKTTENPFSKAWGFSLSDIPFVDIAAGASTYFGAQDDLAAGVPWYAAYPGGAGRA